EDAGYPRQDGKTPWSFTPAWYWDPVLHVQDRWEARKLERQFKWSLPLLWRQCGRMELVRPACKLDRYEPGGGADLSDGALGDDVHERDGRLQPDGFRLHLFLSHQGGEEPGGLGKSTGEDRGIRRSGWISEL